MIVVRVPCIFSFWVQRLSSYKLCTDSSYIFFVHWHSRGVWYITWLPYRELLVRLCASTCTAIQLNLGHITGRTEFAYKHLNEILSASVRTSRSRQHQRRHDWFHHVYVNLCFFAIQRRIQADAAARLVQIRGQRLRRARTLFRSGRDRYGLRNRRSPTRRIRGLFCHRLLAAAAAVPGRGSRCAAHVSRHFGAHHGRHRNPRRGILRLILEALQTLQRLAVPAVKKTGLRRHKLLHLELARQVDIARAPDLLHLGGRDGLAKGRRQVVAEFVEVDAAVAVQVEVAKRVHDAAVLFVDLCADLVNVHLCHRDRHLRSIARNRLNGGR
mmetsp:Transcript_23698/g.59862  ORF Transcript_23698/g.59862 Transcript_23698/m.59862 type:complete len:327 (-) Transcript_23698:4836-5816(-)